MLRYVGKQSEGKREEQFLGKENKAAYRLGKEHAQVSRGAAWGKKSTR